jgi:hypothetical protein
MSIILALTGKFGVVASDSQRVESNGSISQDFDKTFTITKPPLIGAFAGLLEFNDRLISQHVSEILASFSRSSFQAAAELVGIQLRQRLLAIPESEVGFCYRNLELLLVGRSNLRSGPFEIRWLEFKAAKDTNQIMLGAGCYPGAGMYALFGDLTARNSVIKRLDKKRHNFFKMTKTKLKEEAAEVISAAISHSGTHPYHQNIIACGGNPKVQTLS